jgi:RND family efflux transporter MFP subunit
MSALKPNILLHAGWLLVVAALLDGCDKKPTEVGLPPVTAMHPRTAPVTDYLELSGTVSASRTVDLVARVPGYLQSYNFDDGADVTNNQLLFVIEPGPYEEQVKLAEAQLLQAQSEYDRQQDLVKQNATSVASVEKWQSERDQAAAQVALAKINLSYTRVTAPFDGRISRHLVDPGNMVGTSGETKLATLNQIVPIYIYFNMNERDALRIRAAMRERGVDPHNEMGRIPLQVGLQTETGFPHEGMLDYINNGVSSGTGSLPLRAVVTNEDKAIIPGIFARIRLPVTKATHMLVVPNAAVGYDQQGDYVLVVGEGDVVARRSIVKGPLNGSDCSIVSGLTESDRVIINGFVNARPGDRVTVETGPAASDLKP